MAATRYNAVSRMRLPDRSVARSARTLPVLWGQTGLRVAGGLSLPNVSIVSLTDDSRAVVRGSCFVAVRGANHDGHQFIDRAVNAGAAVVVVDRPMPVPSPAIRVPVDDTRAALARLAAAFYGLRGAGAGRPRLVGVTGTNGKTTVAWLLRSVLQAGGNRTALLGTIEYDLLGKREPAPLTTPNPLTLSRHLGAVRDAGADFAVLEVSSHALDQRRTDGLTFSSGVFTNLSGDHLDYHGSMEAYRAAKRRLFDSLDEDAVAVVNRDDPASARMTAGIRAPVWTFGMDARKVDTRAHIDALDSRGTRFTLRGRSFETSVRCFLPGRHNVMNALAAAATAEALGLGADAIRMGIERTAGVPGRLQRVTPDDCPFAVVVDYAHTDDALGNVLRALRPLTDGRLLCVFGCGGDRDRAKRPRMAAAVESVADVAFVTSDNPRTEDPQLIIAEILGGFGSRPECRLEIQVDRRQAIAAAINEAQEGDTVLIAGKGHEDYQLVGDRVLPFDDAEEARACLEHAVLEGSAV